MTVRIHTNLVGVSQEQFAAVYEHVTAGEPPKGLIFHSSGPIDGGWGVVDFWESRQDYERRDASGSGGDSRRGRDNASASGRRGVSGLRDVPALAIEDLLRA